MTKELFDTIFDNNILPFIEEIEANNSLVRRNDLEKCKTELYKEYTRLNQRYKKQIFEPNEDVVLLDRHKVAACICGAFLKVPVLNKTELMQYLMKERQKVAAYFYYVNEMVAFHAAAKFLSIFMVKEKDGQDEAVRFILENFPKMPPIIKNKRGFWNSVVFNLSQIKDDQQIGLEHYDVYSYAMFFFWLEHYFNENIAA